MSIINHPQFLCSLQGGIALLTLQFRVCRDTVIPLWSKLLSITQRVTWKHKRMMRRVVFFLLRESILGGLRRRRGLGRRADRGWWRIEARWARQRDAAEWAARGQPDGWSWRQGRHAQALAPPVKVRGVHGTAAGVDNGRCGQRAAGRTRFPLTLSMEPMITILSYPFHLQTSTGSSNYIKCRFTYVHWIF